MVVLIDGISRNARFRCGVKLDLIAVRDCDDVALTVLKCRHSHETIH